MPKSIPSTHQTLTGEYKFLYVKKNPISPRPVLAGDVSETSASPISLKGKPGGIADPD
jgi:hypothetical protein